jgi:ribonuclease G
VFEGQVLLVQVIKDPIGTKGARLSTQISIAGRLLVFLPQDNHIGVSQKIPTAQRESLRARLQTLAGETGGGFILRTNGEDASDAELAEDVAYLRKAWARIKDASVRQPPLSLLHQDLNLLQRVLRDMVGDTTQVIRLDSREQFDALMVFGREFMPAAAAKLQHYKGERPIFDLFSIDEEIARALGRRVELKSGGYLIVEQTEALTTVDVNTGGFVGARSFDETIFKTNLEAAQAIARQLRLRNLGGIIIADFIDMVREDHREAVLAEFRKQLARDRVKTMVGCFSQLGLVEMTRKRTRESLAHILTEPCEACQGRGHVKTARSVAYDILREILREARQFNPREFRVVASPRVIELLLDEESTAPGRPERLHRQAGFAAERDRDGPGALRHRAALIRLGAGQGAVALQPGIQAVHGHEFLVAALFGDAALFHDHDAVRMLDGGQPVGNDQGGAPRHQALESLLDQALGLGVQRGRGFVQDQDRCVLVECACDRQPLALATGELRGVVPDDRVHPLGQRGDVFMTGWRRPGTHSPGPGRSPGPAPRWRRRCR